MAGLPWASRSPTRLTTPLPRHGNFRPVSTVGQPAGPDGGTTVWRVEQAYTTEQVLRITGVSRRRLAYWLEHGIVSADIDEVRGRSHVRVWSFQNLVEVRVALWLRDRISLQLIGKIVARLRARRVDVPLATVQFAVVENGDKPDDVVIQLADGSWETPITRQIVFEAVLPLARFGDELAGAVQSDLQARRRPGVVERRRGRLGSTPVFAGTRVPVETVRRLHAAGWDEARILSNYPGLTAVDVRAATSARQAG
jgi:uncharacterized protein (DUF433 family)